VLATGHIGCSIYVVVKYLSGRDPDHPGPLGATTVAAAPAD
jgi:hypothetical protein